MVNIKNKTADVTEIKCNILCKTDDGVLQPNIFYIIYTGQMLVRMCIVFYVSGDVSNFLKVTEIL